MSLTQSGRIIPQNSLTASALPAGFAERSQYHAAIPLVLDVADGSAMQNWRNEPTVRRLDDKSCGTNPRISAERMKPRNAVAPVVRIARTASNAQNRRDKQILFQSAPPASSSRLKQTTNSE